MRGRGKPEPEATVVRVGTAGTYHRPGCGVIERHRTKPTTELSRQEAEREGLAACWTCCPSLQSPDSCPVCGRDDLDISLSSHLPRCEERGSLFDEGQEAEAP